MDSAAEPFDWANPLDVAGLFLHALTDPAANAVGLRRLTTEESASEWGDFGKAAEWRRTHPDVGISDSVHWQSPSVAAVRLLPNVPTAVYIPEGENPPDSLFVTLLLRDGSWLVHRVGPAVDPATMPD